MFAGVLETAEGGSTRSSLQKAKLLSLAKLSTARLCEKLFQFLCSSHPLSDLQALAAAFPLERRCRIPKWCQQAMLMWRCQDIVLGGREGTTVMSRNRESDAEDTVTINECFAMIPSHLIFLILSRMKIQLVLYDANWKILPNVPSPTCGNL